MKRNVLWVAGAAILVIIFGTMYIVVQQAERQGANSPQVQLAEDAATLLNQGTNPVSLAPNHVDMAASLTPFLIVYDRSGRVVAGSGYLGGVIPVAPYGILTDAKGSEYHAVTWQPDVAVRIAAVTVAANKYYVLSGRSLREVEKNEDLTFRLSMLGGVLSLIVLVVAYVCASWQPAPKRT